MTCRDIGYHLRYEERIESGSMAAFGKTDNFLMESSQPAYTGTPYNTYPGKVFLFQIKTRILDRLFCHHKGVLCVRVHFAGFLAVYMLAYIKTFEFTCELGFELRRVETGNRPCTAYSGEHCLPCFRGGIAKRSQRTKACYYYSF